MITIEHSPIVSTANLLTIGNNNPVERVTLFKLLDVCMSIDLRCDVHVDALC